MREAHAAGVQHRHRDQRQPARRWCRSCATAWDRSSRPKSSVIASGEEVRDKKPAPDLYQLALQRLGVSRASASRSRTPQMGLERRRRGRRADDRHDQLRHATSRTSARPRWWSAASASRARRRAVHQRRSSTAIAGSPSTRCSGFASAASRRAREPAPPERAYTPRQDRGEDACDAGTAGATIPTTIALTDEARAFLRERIGEPQRRRATRRSTRRSPRFAASRLAARPVFDTDARDAPASRARPELSRLGRAEQRPHRPVRRRRRACRRRTTRRRRRSRKRASSARSSFPTAAAPASSGHLNVPARRPAGRATSRSSA